MIRVFIADDQTLVREGIRSLLAVDREIEVVGEAADGEEAIRRVPRQPVDVLLLDVRMPARNGIEVLKELGAAGALPPTLVLTTFDDTTAVLDGIRAGARGFMLKDVTFEQLVTSIRAIAGGATAFQPAVTERLLRSNPVAIPVDVEPERLTDREIEVVRLMAGGYRNREIARALGTAEGTIKNHVSSILAKLGARDRTRAVLKALESGLLDGSGRRPGRGRTAG